MTQTVPARLSIVTIGVADVARSAAFYDQLGWARCSFSMDEIVWFRTADSCYKRDFPVGADGRITIP
jgi:hypothetical protein